MHLEIIEDRERIIQTLPSPISVPVPSAINSKSDLRKNMMKQELAISPKITQISTVLMRLEPFRNRLCQGHCFCRFILNTDIIEMNRMIELVLECNYNNRITRDLLFNGNINAQEKTNDKKAD